jgi:hypothetical protein
MFKMCYLISILYIRIHNLLILKSENTYMPQVFNKDCKINIIEYGESSNASINLGDLKTKISATIARFIKP